MNRGFADKVGNHVATAIIFTIQRWKYILISYILIITLGSSLLYITTDDKPTLAPRWGGFDERPQTDRCYRQERTAMLLNLFLGCVGADQFYARHWPLAIFKLLTLGGMGVWALIDMILWIVGGVYGTPGCPGGGSKSWAY